MTLRHDDLKELPDFPENAVGGVYCVTEKSQRKWQGVLIHFLDVECMKEGAVGHEALHAAMGVFRMLDIVPDVDNQEPLAYLVEYIIKCISDARERFTGKPGGD